MDTTWKTIQRKLTEIALEIAENFNPPASSDEIDLLEEIVQQPLPNSFKDYLRTFNGQKVSNELINFPDYYCLLSIDRIIDFWKMHRHFWDYAEIIDWMVENKIRPVMGDKGWIPIATFNGSNYLFIDLSPGKNGTYGQVAQFYPGCDCEEEDIVLAKSFEEFSQIILRRLIEHNYEVEGGVVIFNNWI